MQALQGLFGRSDHLTLDDYLELLYNNDDCPSDDDEGGGGGGDDDDNFLFENSPPVAPVPDIDDESEYPPLGRGTVRPPGWGRGAPPGPSAVRQPPLPRPSRARRPVTFVAPPYPPYPPYEANMRGRVDIPAPVVQRPLRAGIGRAAPLSPGNNSNTPQAFARPDIALGQPGMARRFHTAEIFDSPETVPVPIHHLRPPSPSIAQWPLLPGIGRATPVSFEDDRNTPFITSLSAQTPARSDIPTSTVGWSGMARRFPATEAVNSPGKVQVPVQHRRPPPPSAADHNPSLPGVFSSPGAAPTDQEPPPPSINVPKIAEDASVLLELFSRLSNSGDGWAGAVQKEIFHDAFTSLLAIQKEFRVRAAWESQIIKPLVLESDEFKVDSGCIICFSNIADTVVIPCGHLALCSVGPTPPPALPCAKWCRSVYLQCSRVVTKWG